MAMKPTIWLSSGEEIWLEMATDEQGTLSISTTAERVNLLPRNLLLGELAVKEGITV